MESKHCGSNFDATLDKNFGLFGTKILENSLMRWLNLDVRKK